MPGETETDRYRIDVADAIAALKRVEDSTKELSAQVEASGEKQTASFMKAQVAINILAEGFEYLKEASIGAMKEAAEGEKVDAMLRVAAGKWTEQAQATASAFQESLGVSDDVVKKMEAIAFRAGVGAGDMERLTGVVLDFAAATDQDGVSAMNALTRALEMGKDGAKSLGVEYESTGHFAKDLDLAVDALSKKFGGSAAAAADTLAGKVAKLDQQAGELKESWGAFLNDLLAQTGIIETLTEAVKGARSAFFGDEEQMKNNAVQKEFQDLLTTKMKLKEEIDQLQNEIFSMEAFPATNRQILDGYTEKDVALEKLNKKYKEQLENLDALAKFEKARDERASPPKTPDRKVGKDDNAKEKEGPDYRLHQALLDAEVDPNEGVEALEKFNKAVNDAQLAADRKAADKLLDLQSWLEKTKLEKKLASNEALLAAEKAHQEEMIGEFKKYGEQTVGFALQFATEAILAQTQFTDEYREASVRRLAQDDAEAELKARYSEEEWAQIDKTTQMKLLEEETSKSIGDARKMLADQESAANEKRIAEFLANIAQQAATQAIFETAQGFALLGDPLTAPFASAKFTAAAIFASVAAAAGGGAYAISRTRGMTSDEQSQIDALKKQDADRKERETKQRASTVDGGPKINVYNIGISGQTEQEQGAELERIRRQYDKLKTGA